VSDLPGPPRIAVSQWTLREAELDVAIGRIADAGFDAVELGGTSPDPARCMRALAASGLEATSVCPLFGAAHDFASDLAPVRAAAKDLLRRWMDLAGEVGARAVIVVPSDTSSAASSGGRPELLARSAEAIAEVCAGYDDTAPLLVIEPLNRYETHLVHTLEEADELRRMIDSAQVALMADVFHMNIEQDCLIDALRQHAAQVRHVHLADNQRRAPGTGSLNFQEILAVLDEIGYTGTFALEFLPATDEALRASLEHLASLRSATETVVPC
jgi:sugar phosphate isomerase/epimerase